MKHIIRINGSTLYIYCKKGIYMSKFKNLCSAYSTARQNYADYRKCCSEFANSLINGMIEYFECPREMISFFPLTGEFDPKRKYSLSAAMKLDNDTFWHFGLGLTLCPSESEGPDETVILPFSVKKSDDLYTVRFGNVEEFQINYDDKDKYKDFYEYIYNRVRSDYEKGLQRFLDREQSSRKIGFQT